MFGSYLDLNKWESLCSTSKFQNDAKMTHPNTEVETVIFKSKGITFKFFIKVNGPETGFEIQARKYFLGIGRNKVCTVSLRKLLD